MESHIWSVEISSKNIICSKGGIITRSHDDIKSTNSKYAVIAMWSLILGVLNEKQIEIISGIAWLIIG